MPSMQSVDRKTFDICQSRRSQVSNKQFPHSQYSLYKTKPIKMVVHWESAEFICFFLLLCSVQNQSFHIGDVILYYFDELNNKKKHRSNGDCNIINHLYRSFVNFISWKYAKWTPNSGCWRYCWQAGQKIDSTLRQKVENHPHSRQKVKKNVAATEFRAARGPHRTDEPTRGGDCP